MPFVLKHKKTAQIVTDTLINSYDLPYYGTKYWVNEADALSEYGEYLRLRGLDDPSEWEIIEVEEMQMKMFNVRLKNEASLCLYLDEQGKPLVKPAEI